MFAAVFLVVYAVLLPPVHAFVSPALSRDWSTFTSVRTPELSCQMGTENAATSKRAVFGGGCFWCTEAVFKKLDGVSKITSGYAGGTLENPTYRDVCSGRSGHAEVIQVEYDPKKLTYEELLEVFWGSHDSTQGNRQGLDMGTEYRSIILCEDEEQLQEALRSKEEKQAKINKDAVIGKLVGAVMGKKEGENVVDVTTEVDMLTTFWEAEKVHQNYYERNPLSPYCIMNIEPKLATLRPKISKINRETRERDGQSA
ncbi:unnamed protein product [Discosporangium mesarthrocarpum]